VIMASMRLLLGIADPATSAHLRPTNTGMTEWEHVASEDRWLLRTYNDVGHLIDLDRAQERPDDASVVIPADPAG
jgi:hypothetical protein